MDSVNVRNLEQIQEDDPRARTSRAGAGVLLALGGAVLIAAGVVTVRRGDAEAIPATDPLAALVSKAKTDTNRSAEEIDGTDVSFPGLLSDRARPTTALAAVTNENGRLVEQPAGAGSTGDPAMAPPGTERLPIAPLPAGSLLGATAVTTEPKDSLSAMAASRAAPDEAGELAPLGAEGGFQIQVASFKKQEDADRFVLELRKRGHKAYRQAAHVPGRGLWHRVRVGPFKSRFSALQYKRRFEKQERLAPFLVDPFKVKRAAELREARLEARRRRKRR